METSLLTYGPELERTYITAGLDYYKPTMSQLAHEVEPDAEVTFTFKNRGDERLADYIDPNDLQARLDTIRERGFNETELTYLAGIVNTTGERVFYDSYLDHLRTADLPPAQVTMENNDIMVTATGTWSTVTFWETVVMSEINEAYFEGMVHAEGIDVFELYNEGERRLNEKIAILQENPDIKIADFGTRRHFSHRWQRYVLERLLAECPDNVIGTSNVALAQAYNIKPIGTFAHEMPMVFAGLADSRGQDVRAAHNEFLNVWYARYGEDLSTALTDTFTTDFFFSDFTPGQAATWRALRHDSGDPIEFGERAIAFYEDLDIDPKEKTIVFSDGLNIADIVKLHDHFQGRVNITFGWGTSLTNDLGVKALNIVMKATHANGTETVKLSDNPGKHTGTPEKVAEYELLYAA